MTVPLQGGVESELETPVEPITEGPPKAITGRSPWQIAWFRLKRDKTAMTALVIVILVLLTAIAAPILKAVGVLDPYVFHNDLVGGLGSMPTGAWGGISLSHPFGVEP